MERFGNKNPHLQQAGGTLAEILYQQGDFNNLMHQMNAPNDKIYLY
ncbi:hypothetical protein FEDK69T_30950 [Flavobacterium enshiense DK69]|nr:hypothetical protein FEDK69T_30950 [Flavobacterium enshiense DK69]